MTTVTAVVFDSRAMNKCRPKRPLDSLETNCAFLPRKSLASSASAAVGNVAGFPLDTKLGLITKKLLPPK